MVPSKRDCTKNLAAIVPTSIQQFSTSPHKTKDWVKLHEVCMSKTNTITIKHAYHASQVSLVSAHAKYKPTPIIPSPWHGPSISWAMILGCLLASRATPPAAEKAIGVSDPCSTFNTLSFNEPTHASRCLTYHWADITKNLFQLSISLFCISMMQVWCL